MNNKNFQKLPGMNHGFLILIAEKEKVACQQPDENEPLPDALCIRGNSTRFQ
jgi:predicted ester cyclase